MEKNVLVIGNGFDLYHFLPTRYIDFLRAVNRLIELDEMNQLECCRYIKYIWGPDSPIYKNDEYIRECYAVHHEKMKSGNQLRYMKVVESDMDKHDVDCSYRRKKQLKKIYLLILNQRIRSVLRKAF